MQKNVSLAIQNWRFFILVYGIKTCALNVLRSPWLPVGRFTTFIYRCYHWSSEPRPFIATRKIFFMVVWNMYFAFLRRNKRPRASTFDTKLFRHQGAGRLGNQTRSKPLSAGNLLTASTISAYGDRFQSGSPICVSTTFNAFLLCVTNNFNWMTI